MEYREIVAVTGLTGLFQLMVTKNDGAIVRNLADNSTRFISARLHNVTPLESIEVYTTGENVRLHEVLQKMNESDVARPDTKNTNDVFRAYFKSIFPEIDDDRVYASDMKKMLRWFELLKANNLLDFSKLQQQAAGPGTDGEGLTAEGEAQLAENDKEDDMGIALIEGAASDDSKAADKDDEEKPAKKPRPKKAASEGVEGEEKPAKKAAVRKKKEEE